MTDSTNNLPFDLVEGSKLKGAITRLFASAGKVEAAVQNLTLSAIYHMLDCGDSTHVERLLQGFPNGSRVERWSAWVQRNFPVTVDKKAGVIRRRKTIEVDGVKRRPTAEDWDFASAAAQPWHAKPDTQREARTMDVATLVDRLLKIADRDSKAQRTEGVIGFASELTKSPEFKAMVAKWGAIEL